MRCCWPSQRLRGCKYIGRVGTGFSDAQLRTLRNAVDADARARNLRRTFRSWNARMSGWRYGSSPAWWSRCSTRAWVARACCANRHSRPSAPTRRRRVWLPNSPPRKQSRRRPGAAGKTAARATAPPSSRKRVAITHPEREVFPGTGITKGDVAEYYRAVSPWILAEMGGRPLSVVRCPEGSGKPCFFQKHTALGWGTHIGSVDVREKNKSVKYLCIDSEEGLLELVQMNVLEFHPWGAKSSDYEHADRIVFDLDPHPSVKWPRVIAAARDLREQLESIGLRSFLRTSGGKGFHVVVPLDPPAPWDEVKRFAQAVAHAMAQLRPSEFVSVAGEKNREGKIFVDWLRNGRGATSVASYSLRARQPPASPCPLTGRSLQRSRAAMPLPSRTRSLASAGANPTPGATSRRCSKRCRRCSREESLVRVSSSGLSVDCASRGKRTMRTLRRPGESRDPVACSGATGFRLSPGTGAVLSVWACAVEYYAGTPSATSL